MLETVFRKSITRPLPAGAELLVKSRKLTAAERAAKRPPFQVD
ncbi:MAG: hypothetical protein U0935_14210 [Pirellulales bacterium]